MTTAPTLDLGLATEPQIALYTKVVREFVALTGYDAAKAEEAIANFPSLKVGIASQRITKALNSLSEAKANAPKPEPVKAAKPEFTVWPGLYTVVDEAGDRRTFKVEVQASDAKFAPNSVILSVLTGPENTSDYTGFAFLDGAKVRPWKRYAGAAELLRFAERLVTDPASALVAKHCARCGETLTVPESIAAGYGPVCAKKGLR